MGRNPSVLMTPKHILEPESRRIIEILPSRIQKAIRKMATIANTAWIKPGQESFTVEKLLRPIQKAWSDCNAASNRIETTSGSSDEEENLDSPSEIRPDIREDVLEQIDSQENWDSLYSTSNMVSYQVWKDLLYPPRLFAKMKAKGYAKYVSSILEAEHLFHTEQIPFTPRIMVQGFRKILREMDPTDPPRECEFAVLDMMSVTSTALSNMSLPTFNREQHNATATQTPAKLIGTAQEMQEAIWKHELYIAPYQAWGWQEKIEDDKGLFARLPLSPRQKKSDKGTNSHF